MPKLSPYGYKLIEEKKAKAIHLYTQGMTLREIGKILARSRTWVWKVIKQYNSSVKLTKEDNGI
jgi:transposase